MNNPSSRIGILAGIRIGEQLNPREPIIVSYRDNIRKAMGISVATFKRWRKAGMPVIEGPAGEMIALMPLIQLWLVRYKQAGFGRTLLSPEEEAAAILATPLPELQDLHEQNGAALSRSIAQHGRQLPLAKDRISTDRTNTPRQVPPSRSDRVRTVPPALDRNRNRKAD